MRIAFLGTPEFALPSLRMLLAEGHELAVFTQPDRPVGRKAVQTAPPVKALALEHGLPVYQFEKIRLHEGQAALAAFAPEILITAAFGQLLSAENLAAAPHGCINVHGSLLPKYRGAAPIQWAVINGETTTGITTMQTDIGLDTGDILLAREVAIGPDETAGSLYERLAGIGAEVLQETIARLQAGTLTRTPQDEAAATKCGMLKKEDGRLCFTQPAQWVHNRVRGTNPWPGAYALLRGEPLKIRSTRLAPAPTRPYPPGTCYGSAKEGLFIACGQGAVEVLELQAPGCKCMEAMVFLCGKSLIGEVLQ